LLAVAQALPGFLDGARGHGLHPEALDRFVDLADLHDILENQFAFAARVAGIDDNVELLLPGEAEDVLEAIVGLLDRLEFEVVGDGREDLEIPGQVFAVPGGL